MIITIKVISVELDNKLHFATEARIRPLPKPAVTGIKTEEFNFLMCVFLTLEIIIITFMILQ